MDSKAETMKFVLLLKNVKGIVKWFMTYSYFWTVKPGCVGA